VDSGVKELCVKLFPGQQLDEVLHCQPPFKYQAASTTACLFTI